MVDVGPPAPLPDDWEPPPREMLVPDVAAARDAYCARINRAVLDAVIATIVGLLVGLLGAMWWRGSGVAVLTLGALAYGLCLIWWTWHRYRPGNG